MEAAWWIIVTSITQQKVESQSHLKDDSCSLKIKAKCQSTAGTELNILQVLKQLKEQ